MSNEKKELSKYKIQIGTAIHLEFSDQNGRVAETDLEKWRAA